METTRENRSSLGTAFAATVEHGPVCSCGQDLDCCSGAHCPRCGTVLGCAAGHPDHVARGPLGWVA